MLSLHLNKWFFKKYLQQMIEYLKGEITELDPLTRPWPSSNVMV